MMLFLSYPDSGECFGIGCGDLGRVSAGFPVSLNVSPPVQRPHKGTIPEPVTPQLLGYPGALTDRS